ncbi:hypothetical protein V8E36_003223 [Tilletia maclaganii]
MLHRQYQPRQGYERDKPYHPALSQRPAPPPPTSVYHQQNLRAQAHPYNQGQRPEVRPPTSSRLEDPNLVGLGGHGRTGASGGGKRYVSGPARATGSGASSVPKSAAHVLAQAGIQRCDAVSANEAWSRYGFRGGTAFTSNPEGPRNAFPHGVGGGSDVGPLRNSSMWSDGSFSRHEGEPGLGMSPYGGIADFRGQTVRKVSHPTRELPWSSLQMSTCDSTASRSGPPRTPDRSAARTPTSRRDASIGLDNAGPRRVLSLAMSTTSQSRAMLSAFSPSESVIGPSVHNLAWRGSVPNGYEQNPSTSAAKLHEHMLQQRWANHRTSAPSLQHAVSMHHQQGPRRGSATSSSSTRIARNPAPAPSRHLRQAFGPPTMLPTSALPAATVSRQSSSYSHNTTTSSTGSLAASLLLSGPLKLKPGQLVPRALSEAAGSSCASSILSGCSPPGPKMMRFSEQRWQPQSSAPRVGSLPRIKVAVRQAPQSSARPPPDEVTRIAQMDGTSTFGQRQEPETDQISELISLYRQRTIRNQRGQVIRDSNNLSRSASTRASTPDAASRTFSTKSLHSVELTSDSDCDSGRDEFGQQRRRPPQIMGLGIRAPVEAAEKQYTGRRSASACISSAAAAARMRVQARRAGKLRQGSSSSMESDGTNELESATSGRARSRDQAETGSETASKRSLAEISLEPPTDPDTVSAAEASPYIGLELQAALQMLRTPSVWRAGQEVDFTDEQTFLRPETTGLLVSLLPSAADRPILLQGAISRAPPTAVVRKPVSSKQALAPPADSGSAGRRRPVSTPTLPVLNAPASSAARARPTTLAPLRGNASQPTCSESVAPLRIRPKLAAAPAMMADTRSKSVASSAPGKAKRSVAKSAIPSSSTERGSTDSSRVRRPAAAVTKTSSGRDSVATRSTERVPASKGMTTANAKPQPKGSSQTPKKLLSEQMQVSSSESSVYSQQSEPDSNPDSGIRSPGAASEADFDECASAMRVVEDVLARALGGDLGRSTAPARGGAARRRRSNALARSESDSGSVSDSSVTLRDSSDERSSASVLVSMSSSASIMSSDDSLSVDSASSSSIASMSTIKRTYAGVGRMVAVPPVKGAKASAPKAEVKIPARSASKMPLPGSSHQRLRLPSPTDSSASSRARPHTTATSKSGATASGTRRESATATPTARDTTSSQARVLHPRLAALSMKPTTSTSTVGSSASSSCYSTTSSIPRRRIVPPSAVAVEVAKRSSAQLAQSQQHLLMEPPERRARRGAAEEERSRLSSFGGAGVGGVGGANRLPVAVHRRALASPSELVQQIQRATVTAAAAAAGSSSIIAAH